MHRILKRIKEGAYAQVAEINDTKVNFLELHYNKTRHKFYLAEDKRGLRRRSISGWQAETMVLNTLTLKPKTYAVRKKEEINET